MGIIVVGGRQFPATQESHAIPRRFFEWDKKPIVTLFTEMGGSSEHFNYNGPHNVQDLPAGRFTDFGDHDASHIGGHKTGYSDVIEQRLAAIDADVRGRYAAQIALAANEAADPAARAAAQVEVRDEIARQLRAEAEMLQFKATNFMDSAGDVGNRLVFNSRDVDYFMTTDTFNQLPPAEQDRIRTSREIPGDIIKAHNTAVVAAPLTSAQELEKKVMRDLGSGLLGLTDGSQEARDTVRGIIAEAERRGFNLRDPNFDSTNALRQIVDDLNVPINAIDIQINDLTTQIDAANGATRDALIAQRDGLVAQRQAILAAQTIGSEASPISANRARTTLMSVLTSRGSTRAMSAAGAALLAGLVKASNPITAVADTVMLTVDLDELAMRKFPKYEDMRQELHRLVTGRELNRATYIEGDDHRSVLLTGYTEDGIPIYELTVIGYRGRGDEIADAYIVDWINIDGQHELHPVFASYAEELANGGMEVDWWIIDKVMNDPGSLDVEVTPFKPKYAVSYVKPPDGDPFAGYMTWWDRFLAPVPLPEPVMEPVPIRLEEPHVDIELDEDTPLVHIETQQLDAQGNPVGEPETRVAVSTGQGMHMLTLGAAGLGSALGSFLASRMDIDNPFLSIAVSTVLSTFTSDLAVALASPDVSLTEAFENLPRDLREAGVGAISSYLWGEVVADLGVDGAWGSALTAVGGAAIATIANNIITALQNGTPVFAGGAWRAGVGTAMLNAAASFLGTYLASELVEFHTEGGQIGAMFGTQIGAIIGGIWGPIGSFIGAFVGYIFGGMIGTALNGPLKSGVQLAFGPDGQGFTLTGAYAKNGATVHVANRIGGAVADSLKAVMQATGAYLVDWDKVRLGEYRTRNTRFQYVTQDANGKNFIALDVFEVEKVIRLGVMVALADMLPRLAGGNVYMKRAIAATYARAGLDPAAIPLVKYQQKYRTNVPIDPATLNAVNSFDLNVLAGNLTIASDYTALLQNRDAVSRLIAAEPDSPMAVIWAATIATAIELGLNRRAPTDWIGGWTMFLDEAANGLIDGVTLSPANLEIGISAVNERVFEFYDTEGNSVGMLGDTIDSDAKNIIVATDTSDTISISGASLANTSGLMIDGAAGSGSLAIDIAAVIYAEGGDDTVIAGDRGNDVTGGEGNDLIVGGKLDDWLFGDAGNDRLFAAQPANYQFADSDAAAVALAIGTASNGDMLDGGTGNDLLYGSAGSDWLRGGDGVDTLRGGAGADLIEGGAGNDRGAGGQALLLGGSGNDQYIFGYGDGQDVIFDESSPGVNPGFITDSIYSRIQSITAGTILRNWGGGGEYESDGTIKGGEDAIAFGMGISLQDLRIRRSGTSAAPGNDLIIQLTWLDPATGIRRDLADQITIQDWFESTRRVEWLRFTNGEEIRIADISSYIVGTGLSDLIIGTDQADFMYGGSGNDTLYGLQGDDFGFGGEGNDLVAGDGDNDMVSGGSGNDVVMGAQGNDTVFGDAGDDTLNGGLGSDLLVGGRGADFVVGGDGDDIIKFARGDGRDSVMDSYVDNWEVVYQNGSYINGYVRNTATGVITKNGVVVFDGMQWIGVYDFTESTATLRRHLGPVGGVLAGNSGSADTLEFGAGINIQDLLLRRQGNDLEIAVAGSNVEAPFESVADRVSIKDWYTAGAAIERFTFLATGIHNIAGMTLEGLGTDGADVLTGTAGNDWITGNSGDDTVTASTGDDIISGNGGNDILRGEAGTDVLYGGAGDDLLEGGADNDFHIGGSGTDIASYASASAAVRVFLNAPSTATGFATYDQFVGIEGIEGSAFADRLGGDFGDNILRGLAGNDYLAGGAGDDVYEIEPNNGQDTILDSPFITEEIITREGYFNDAQYQATWTHLGIVSTANGDRRAFRLVVTRRVTGEEVYRSRDGIDYLYATNTSATRPIPTATSWISNASQWSAALGVTRPISGTGSHYTVRELYNTAQAGGYDTLDFGGTIGLTDLTFARLNGGADLRITYASNQHVTITGQNDLNRAIDVLQLRDGLTADLTRLVLVGETASEHGDFIVGDANANTLDGLAGDDVLSGAAGVDTLRGGEGDDILEGGAGADTLDGGNDAISSGQAIDTSDIGSYGDTIRYVRSTAAVNINLNLATPTASGGHAASDVIVAVNGVSTIENIVGSDGFGDTLRGDSRANRLSGLGGNDTLEGNAGNDVLGGGQGNDILRGGDGNDNLTGDAGDDTLEGGNHDDLIAGGDGIDSLQGDAGEDILVGGDGNDTLRGGADDDTVSGEAGNDQLWGDAGADELTGGDGDDILQGGTEDDALVGDAGIDQLHGDAGNDNLQGGDGNDTLRGGDGNDELLGDAGDDQLHGDAGDDRFTFGTHSGADTLIDATGDNSIALVGVERDQVWLTRVGNDLRVGVVGGNTVVTVQGYYASATPTRVSRVLIGTETLYLAGAEPLIQAMTAISAAVTPAEVPEAIADAIGDYWFAGGAAAPVVGPQSLSTNEDTALTGSVQATDPDGNITGYAVAAGPTLGALNLNTTAGTWTYTPNTNVNGTDTFDIRVTDADGNSSIQRVTVAITPVNDAPTAINVSGLVSSVDERDRPINTAPAPAAIVLANLSVSDPDAGGSGDFAVHRYSVSNPDFEVVGNQLRLRASALPNYEFATTLSVNVTATDRDGAGLSVVRGFTFNVNNRDDYFYGTAGGDNITGTAGQNLIYGQGGNDILTGANANDVIDGGDGADQLNGLGGNDTLEGVFGDDTLDGGTGDDILRGGDGNDTLRGSDGVDQLFGQAGLDILQGGIGNDQLDGGADGDQLDGGAGDDRLVGGTGSDTLVGGAGADRFLGGTDAGGGDVDVVSYAAAASGVTLNVSAGTGTGGEAAGDIFEDAPERIIGSNFDDDITGSAGADTLEGGTGNDRLVGGAGADRLIGGEGNDILDAQSGDDLLDGGAGNDTLIGGADNDRYRIDVNSGADVINNYDPNGVDSIDSIGYDGILNRNLWFERSGNDLIVTAVGTTVSTTIRDWYVLAPTVADRSSFKIDFFETSGWAARTINAEALVNLMALYTRPTTIAQYDTLHLNSSFESPWMQGWNLNTPPTLGFIDSQSINEDGTFTFDLVLGDDFTVLSQLDVTAMAVRADNHGVEDLSVVNAPSIIPRDAAGNRRLIVTTRPNASGVATIKVRVSDGGTNPVERVFTLNVTPVTDTPTVTQASVSSSPTPPATRHTFDGGATIRLNLQAALGDQDGSESLAEIRVSEVPNALSLNGTRISQGATHSVWSMAPGQLGNVLLSGPANWSQDLTLQVTAYARENSTGALQASTAVALGPIVINARPTDINSSVMGVQENRPPGTQISTLTTADGDGDSVTYELLDSAGGRFSLTSGGVLSTGNTNIDYEQAQLQPITIRVTDAGGLTFTEQLTFLIGNVNEAPTSLAPSGTLQVNEYTAPGTVIGSYTRSDPDVGDSATYTLLNHGGGRVALSSSGQLTVGSTISDYIEGGPAQQSFTIRVRVTDGGGNSIEREDPVYVMNVNEAPTINTSSFSIPEVRFATTGAALPATVSGSDPDGTPLSWSIVGGHSNIFSIDSNGTLHLVGHELDYDLGPRNYSITVQASDGFNAVQRSIPITITDVNEAPTAVWQTGTPPPAYYRGRVVGTDPEGAAVTVSLVSAQVYVHTISWDSGINTYDGYDWWPVGGITSYLSLDSIGRTYASMTAWTNGDPNGDPPYYSEIYPEMIEFVARLSDGSRTSDVTVRWNGWTSWMLPVVLDLDGDGVELVALQDSRVNFLMGGEQAGQTGWVGADDGFLALDRDGSGTINSGAEISFVGDAPDAMTDLEGLAAYDTNANGLLDAGDERFADFVVWSDANQDGESQASELRSLTEAKIASVSLLRTLTDSTKGDDNLITVPARFSREQGGFRAALEATDTSIGTPASRSLFPQNTISATADFVRLDGTRGTAADVALVYRGYDTEIVDQYEVDPVTGERLDPVPAAAAPNAQSGLDEMDRSSYSPPKPDIEALNRVRGQVVEDQQDERPLGGAGDGGAPRQARIQPGLLADTADALRNRPWRVADFDGREQMDEEWQPQQAGHRGALHAPLDLVARRRLQMIDAMASFSPEGAAELDLHPQRRVDSRTLELLTPVSTTESWNR